LGGKVIYAGAIFLLVLKIYSPGTSAIPSGDRPLRNLNQDTITQAVIARLSDTPDARLKEVLTCVVQHLHAFAREVHLTEAELQAGIEFLTAVGNKCSASRQEFVLLADVLGLSTLTVAMNHDKPAGCTEATTSGPFYLPDAQPMASGADLAGDAPGQRRRRWRCGSLMPMAATTCSTKTWVASARAACFPPDPMAGLNCAACSPAPTRSPKMGRWAS
jgi:hypothetical protein